MSAETATWCVTRNGYADEFCPPGNTHVHYDVEYDANTGRVLTGPEEQIVRMNEQVFREEEKRAFWIVQRNRHRSVEPFEWFGPSPEPCEPGPGCKCSGCHARQLSRGTL